MEKPQRLVAAVFSIFITSEIPNERRAQTIA
jgi:hypothetical protein